MVMMTERKPRLIVPPMSFEPSAYVVVICTGRRENGKSCNRPLGEINIDHPHDVKYTCRVCGSTYVLQKPIT